jgi:hypothetical protein
LKMRDVIFKHKLDWIDKMEIGSDAYYVQQWLDKLDQEMISYEARWGVDVLPKVAPPELRAKWDKQMEKLNTAILENDVMVIGDLVSGAIRGLVALEQHAYNSGHRQHGQPIAWTVRMPDGRQLAIVENNIQAGVLQGVTKYNDNTVIYTIEQIAHMVAKLDLCSVIDKREAVEAQPKTKRTQDEDFSFKDGDVIPW